MWRVLKDSLGLGEKMASGRKDGGAGEASSTLAVAAGDSESRYAADAVENEEEIIAQALQRAEEEHEADLASRSGFVGPPATACALDEFEFAVDLLKESPSFSVVRGRWRRARA